MQFIDNLTEKVGRKIYDISWSLVQNQPKITIIAGLACMGVSVVCAYKARPKADKVIEEYRKKLEEIEEAKTICDEDDGEGSEAMEEAVDNFDYDHDRAVATVQCIGGMAKSVAFSAVAFGIGTALILKGMDILDGRLADTSAALAGVMESFALYRKRNIERNGEASDLYCRFGVEETGKTVEKIVNENGETVEKEVTTAVPKDPLLPSDYAKFFGPGNPKWTGDYWCDLMFLRGRQNLWTDHIHDKPTVLNEVYEDLGFSKTPQGAAVGWIYGNGDNVVDFGISKIEGRDPSRVIMDDKGRYIFILDFNVDGPIWHKL